MASMCDTQLLTLLTNVALAVLDCRDGEIEMIEVARHGWNTFGIVVEYLDNIYDIYDISSRILSSVAPGALVLGPNLIM
ncbi:hypothetical protein EAE99_010379 [Botrytis elliptica]|nr:hypothetical protein EAE99_010379 [Botrytis elliptica]